MYKDQAVRCSFKEFVERGNLTARQCLFINLVLRNAAWDQIGNITGINFTEQRERGHDRSTLFRRCV